MLNRFVLVCALLLSPLPAFAQNEETLADIRQQLTALYVDVQRLRRELSTTGGLNAGTIGNQGKIILDGQAAWLLANADYRAVIEGHADEQGTREYNLALGQRRANAVREYLVSRGVPTGNLQVTSFGKEKPISICSEESCYAQNRRAVTVLSFSAITS